MRRAHLRTRSTLLQEANRRLDEQARDLERSNRDLEQFAYVATHDLQEPLRKVSSFCQLLQRRYGGQLDERADQYIGFAVDGAQRMQRLINDLLAFSRVGRTTAGFERGRPATTIALAAAAQLEPTRTDAGRRDRSSATLPVVQGDPALLRQLLRQPVGNGLKFRRPDVAAGASAVDAGATATSWEISVADNGIGIEPEYADKVFVIFQRLHARDATRAPASAWRWRRRSSSSTAAGSGSTPTRRENPAPSIRFTLPGATRRRTDDPQEQP